MGYLCIIDTSVGCGLEKNEKGLTFFEMLQFFSM